MHGIKTPSQPKHREVEKQTRIQVSCALIEQGELLLCVQRSESMQHAGKWELPGGKLEPGETPEQCLIRECEEELGIRLSIVERLPAVRHAYPEGPLIELMPFRCSIGGGALRLHEHSAHRWLEGDQLKSLDWLEADRPIIAKYAETRNRQGGD